MAHRPVQRLSVLLAAGVCAIAAAQGEQAPGPRDYAALARQCADVLLECGTDRYGEKQTPLLVSILDVTARACPRDPAPLDEAYRVTRRERRNPAGANLLTDQPLIGVLFRLSEETGESKYADAARAYMAYCLEHLVDEKGFLWWGWHRHYDVYTDTFEGHSGNHHEIHAIHLIHWDRLWAVNPEAVRREIEAIWKWHVIDKTTGEINRHGDGRRGCDFAMSAGSFIRAFAFLYSKTNEAVWLDRAKLLARYYHDRRNLETDLFADRPNAGSDRFDGSAFVTSITGCYCRALLDAHRLSGEPVFRDYALAYLRAYARYGYDEKTKTYWGALRLDGTPIAGPREPEGYAKYEPRGPLDLWEPYVAGYQYALYTAEAYMDAYELTQGAEFLDAAARFAAWIARTRPGAIESAYTWYAPYSQGPGQQGTYAGKYGRAVLFLLRLHAATNETAYQMLARTLADEAVAKLGHNGLFRGHPAKPYYEAMDGVGYLLEALLELDAALE